MPTGLPGTIGEPIREDDLTADGTAIPSGVTDDEVDIEAIEPTWASIWLPRLGMATLVVVAVFFGTTWVFVNTTDFLITLIISFFVAFALMPAVEILVRRGWRRGPAALVAMGGAVLVVVVFLIAIVPIFVDQIVALVRNLPELIDTGVVWVNDTFGASFNVDELEAELAEAGVDTTSIALGVAGGVLGFASSLIGAVFKGLTIGLFVFYILADYPKLRAALLRRFHEARQRRIDIVITITIEKVGGYVYSRSVLAAISAAFHFVVFA